MKEFGQIDILVSNAGICRLGDFLTQSDEDRDAHLDINVKGAWNTCKAVLPVWWSASGAKSSSCPLSPAIW